MILWIPVPVWSSQASSWPPLLAGEGPANNCFFSQSFFPVPLCPSAVQPRLPWQPWDVATGVSHGGLHSRQPRGRRTGRPPGGALRTGRAAAPAAGLCPTGAVDGRSRSAGSRRRGRPAGIQCPGRLGWVPVVALVWEGQRRHDTKNVACGRFGP